MINNYSRQHSAPILVLLLIGVLSVYAMDVLLPFILAALIAYFLKPLCQRITNQIQNNFVPFSLVAVIAILALYSILTIIFVLLIPLVYQQFLIIYQIITTTDIDQAQRALMVYINTYLPEALHHSAEKIMVEIPSYIIAISKTIFSQLVSASKIAAAAVVNIFLAPFIAYYFMIDGPILRKAAQAIMPPQYYNTIGNGVTKIRNIMVVFCKAQLVACIIWFFYYGSLFYIIGLKYAIQLGIVSAIMALIPYLGAIITLLLSVILTIVQFGIFDSHLLIVLAIYGIGHLIEMVYVSNYIIGKRLGLHPLLTLFSLLLSAKFFGVMGMFLAMPTAVVAKMVLENLHKKSHN